MEIGGNGGEVVGQEMTGTDHLAMKRLVGDTTRDATSIEHSVRRRIPNRRAVGTFGRRHRDVVGQVEIEAQRLVGCPSRGWNFDDARVRV